MLVQKQEQEDKTYNPTQAVKAISKTEIKDKVIKIVIKQEKTLFSVR